MFRSIETVVLDFSAGGVLATVPLTQGQVAANCLIVPTKEHDFGLQGSQIGVDLQVVAGPLRVQGQRDTGVAGPMILTCNVLEADPTKVTVYKGTWFMALGGLVAAFGFPAVNLARTWAIAHGRYVSPPAPAAQWDEVLECSLTGVNAGQVRRDSPSAQMLGHWEVAEGVDATVWTVQQIQGQVPGGSVSIFMPGLVPVTYAQTWIVASYRTTEASAVEQNGGIRFDMPSGNSLWMGRNASPPSTCDGTVFVIDTPGARVWRYPDNSMGVGVAQADVVFGGTVDLTRAFVHGANHLCWGGVHCPRSWTGGAQPASSFLRQWLLNSTTVRAHRSETLNDLWWYYQVVELPLSGDAGGDRMPVPGPIDLRCCVVLPTDAPPVYV